MQGLRPLDLVSFERERETLMEATRAKAREILQAAMAEAEKIRARAREEGRGQGEEQGRRDAMEAERARIAQETAGVAGVLQSVAFELAAARERLRREGETAILRLAMAIAERVIGAEVAAGKPVAASVLRRAVELATARRHLEVKVAPQDLEAIQAYLPNLRREVLDIAEIRAVADPAVTPGGCVVLMVDGAVDMDIRTQLDEIERQWIGT